MLFISHSIIINRYHFAHLSTQHARMCVRVNAHRTFSNWQTSFCFPFEFVVQSRVPWYRNWSPNTPDDLVLIHFTLSLSPSNYSVFLASVSFPLFSRLLGLSLFLSLPSGDGRESLHALGRSEWSGPAGSPSSGLLSFWREPPRRFSFYRFPPSLPPFPSPGPSPTSFS